MFSDASGSVGCDIAIVGAGPAGSACAISLLQRRSGLRIALIDRDVQPRPKPCGDLISPVTQRRLSRLGLGVEDRWAVSTHTIASPSGIEDSVSGAPDSPWLRCRVVERRDFDLALLNRARALGGIAMEGRRMLGADADASGWKLRLSGSGSMPTSLIAKVLVGADGAASTVARAVGLPGTDVGAVALRGYAELTRDGTPWSGTRMDFLPTLLPGYGWAFTVDASGRANVGVGRDVSDARTDARSLHDVLHAYLDHLRQLGYHASPLTEVRGARLAVRARDAVTSRRVALVGDAAGLVSPVDGEGISMALASGIRLGELLAQADPDDEASTERSLAEYADWFQRLARPHLERGRSISTWMANPAIAERVLAHDGCTRFARLASGKMQPLREVIAAG